MPMTTLSAANRDTIVALIISSLRDLYEQNGIDADGDLSEDTCLIGHRAALDSLGLVTLIVDLEQKIEETFDIALTLANERAMSQKHSPFLTVGSLATYICTLLDEQRNA
jgi:acyl carrier protein